VTNLSRIVARNSAFGIGAQILIKVLSFIFSVYIIRHLGAETYGQYAAILAFGALFVFVADLGLGTYAVREIARRRGNPDQAATISEFVSDIVSLRMMLAVLAAFLIIVTAWLSGRPGIMVAAIALNTVGLFMYSIQGGYDAALAGHERLDQSAKARVLQQMTFVIFGSLALWIGLGYFGLIFANLAGIAVTTVFCWQAARHLGVRFQGVERRHWVGLLRSSWPFGIVAFTLGLSYRFDSVLLNIYWGDAPTGYYNAAYNFVFMAVVLSNVANTALYPSLSRHAATTPQELPAIYARLLRYIICLSLPIAFGGWVLAQPIVGFLYTEEYASSVRILQVIIWVVPLMFLSEFLGYVILIAGKEKFVARSVLISSGINVALNLYLIPRYGMPAAAAMTIVTETILVAQYFWLLRDEFASRFNWDKVVLRPALACLGMTALLWSLPQLHVLVLIGVGALSYVLLLVVLGVIGIRELELMRSLGYSFGTKAGV
jgi:O-antigen/teichoic acid export membrane protein